MIFYTYVDVLFDIARKDGLIDAVNEQFEILMALIDRNPDWITTLDTPVLSNSRKLELMKQLNLFDETFTRFIMVLIKNRHVRLISDIYNEWIIRSRREQKIAHIQLYAASVPTSEQLQEIREEIQPLIPDLAIEFNIHIDSSLIQGVRLYYQGRSMERSLRRDLLDMKGAL